MAGRHKQAFITAANTHSWRLCDRLPKFRILAQVSQAQAAISKEQKLKDQLREQMAAAANDSKRQVRSTHHQQLQKPKTFLEPLDVKRFTPEKGLIT